MKAERCYPLPGILQATMNLNIAENAVRDEGRSFPNIATAVYQLIAFAIVWALSKMDHFRALFSISPDWPLYVFPEAHAYVKTHPVITFCIAGLVFFGPITFALPLVVGQDVTIHLLLNICYLFHGLISIQTLLNYYHSTSNALAFAPAVFRLEAVFAALEDISARYNKWTTEWMPLLIMRLLAAALCVYIIAGVLLLWK